MYGTAYNRVVVRVVSTVVPYNSSIAKDAKISRALVYFSALAFVYFFLLFRTFLIVHSHYTFLTITLIQTFSIQ